VKFLERGATRLDEGVIFLLEHAHRGEGVLFLLVNIFEFVLVVVFCPREVHLLQARVGLVARNHSVLPGLPLLLGHCRQNPGFAVVLLERAVLIQQTLSVSGNVLLGTGTLGYAHSHFRARRALGRFLLLFYLSLF